MTTMRMRGESPPDPAEQSAGQAIGKHGSDVDQFYIDAVGKARHPIHSAGGKQTRGTIGRSVSEEGPDKNPGRRQSVVTFDLENPGCNGTDEDASRRQSGVRLDYRRMSAPELPPIRNSVSRNASIRGYGSSGSLLKNHSSGSLGDRRRVSTQSPNSQRSSSSSQSNRFPPTSWYQQNEPIPAIGSTSNSKLETLFEKRKDMKPDTGTPRTTSSQGGYSPHKLGRMPSLVKSVNNNTTRMDRMSIRDSKGNAKKKKSTQMKHSVSESHLVSKIPGITGPRLQSRLGMSSTSSVHNSSNNNNKMTLSRHSSEQRLKDKSRNIRNNNIKKSHLVDANSNTITKKNSESGTVNGMRRYSSTFVINRSESKEDGETEGDGTDEEESDRRIIHWLIGADDAEPPPEPEIDYADEPPQTDTALHIVYDGD